MQYTDWTIYITFLGAGLVLLLPRDARALIRWVALLTGLAGLGVALVGYFHYDTWLRTQPAGSSGMVRLVDGVWIPLLGIRYLLAVDGISFPLVVLNGFVCVAGILFSWNIEQRTKEFFVCFLTLIAGVYGVFLAMDLFLLFVFYELAIIPKYFLIAIWGSTRKEYGAMKLVLYSFVGSALVFIAMLALFFAVRQTNPNATFSLVELAHQPVSAELQRWLFVLFFVGFGILAGLWPLHTWAPTGHVAAPTAASMLLAGVVMKLGAYGCLRVGMWLCPAGLDAWRWWMGWLAVIGIVYGAAVALVQKDFKFIIGYSSVSHMGYVLLGLATLNVIGLSGAVLQMFSHGIVAGLLFAVVGRMVYDRTHTRQLNELGGLARVIPFAAVTFIIAGAASMGLPGFSGFVAEIQVLIGAFEMSPWLAVGAALGIPITVAYILHANNKVFMERGDDDPALAVRDFTGLPPITLPEKVAAVLLMALLVIVGLYPPVMLDMIRRNVELFLGGLP